MCNAMEKTFEARWKKRMIAQAKNKVPALSPTHDLKCARCKSKNKFKMMIIREFSNLSKGNLCLFLVNCSKEGTHVATFKERNFHIDLKCTWKSNGPKLFTPIASNKKRQKSNKNLEVMTRATKAQLPK